jgi:UDP-N-acetylglucosamine 2-epimerase
MARARLFPKDCQFHYEYPDFELSRALFSTSILTIIFYNVAVLKSNTQLEFVTIAGNRPEIIKLSELVKSLEVNYKSGFVYTGQHYSQNMRDVFFDELEVKFDYDLKSSTSDVNALRKNIRKFLNETHPKNVIIYGDTNSSMAGALAAKDTNCVLIHIEAGLRNFNQGFVEESNRVRIDSMSDHLLAPTELANLFLKYENLHGSISVTGNLIVDVCRKYAKNIETSPEKDFPSEYILLTLHKPAVVEDLENMKKLCKLLEKIKYKIVFPAHPRTLKNMAKYQISLPQNVTAIEAVGYKDFLRLLKNCLLVMTDSGGVQEEAVLLSKPCITLFSTTDRQETILINANRLFYPFDNHQSISDVIEERLNTKITVNPYGENVTNRVLKVLNKIVNLA